MHIPTLSCVQPDYNKVMDTQNTWLKLFVFQHGRAGWFLCFWANNEAAMMGGRSMVIANVAFGPHNKLIQHAQGSSPASDQVFKATNMSRRDYYV